MSVQSIQSAAFRASVPARAIFSPALHAPAKADDVKFGRKTCFSKKQADQLAEAILAEHKRVPALVPEGEFMSVQGISALLQNGMHLPLNGRFLLGVVYPDGKSTCVDSDRGFHTLAERMAVGKHTTFSEVMKGIFPRIPPGTIPKEGLAILIRQRDPLTRKKAKAFIEKELIPTFQVNKSIPLKNGKTIHVLEAAPFPFLSDVIANHPQPPQGKALRERLDDLAIFQLSAPLADPQVEAAIRKAYEPLHQMLAALEIARMLYSEGLELKEAVEAALLGGGIGFVGETGIEHFLHDGGAAAWAARAGILSSIDVIDNFLSSRGALKAILQTNGLGLKDVYAPKRSFWSKILKPWKMDGPAGGVGKRAVGSVVKGTAVGMGFSAASAGLITDPSFTVPERAAGSALGAVGTATAIPFNTRATMPQIYLTILELIKENKIPLPETCKTEKDIRLYAQSLATQELTSRLAYAATIKAFSLVPFVAAGIMSLEAVGVPREIVQKTFMTVAPAMENLIRTALTLNKQKITIPSRMMKAEKLAVHTPFDPFTPAEERQLESLFADRWARLTLKMLTVFKKMPEPVDFPKPKAK